MRKERTILHDSLKRGMDVDATPYWHPHIDNDYVPFTETKHERNENCARPRFKTVMTSRGVRKRRFLNHRAHTVVETQSRASTWRVAPTSPRQDRKFLFADAEGRDIFRENTGNEKERKKYKRHPVRSARSSTTDSESL